MSRTYCKEWFRPIQSSDIDYLESESKDTSCTECPHGKLVLLRHSLSLNCLRYILSLLQPPLSLDISTLSLGHSNLDPLMYSFLDTNSRTPRYHSVKTLFFQSLSTNRSWTTEASSSESLICSDDGYDLWSSWDQALVLIRSWNLQAPFQRNISLVWSESDFLSSHPIY